MGHHACLARRRSEAPAPSRRPSPRPRAARLLCRPGGSAQAVGARRESARRRQRPRGRPAQALGAAAGCVGQRHGERRPRRGREIGGTLLAGRSRLRTAVTVLRLHRRRAHTNRDACGSHYLRTGGGHRRRRRGPGAAPPVGAWAGQHRAEHQLWDGLRQRLRRVRQVGRVSRSLGAGSVRSAARRSSKPCASWPQAIVWGPRRRLRRRLRRLRQRHVWWIRRRHVWRCLRQRHVRPARHVWRLRLARLPRSALAHGSTSSWCLRCPHFTLLARTQHTAVAACMAAACTPMVADPWVRTALPHCCRQPCRVHRLLAVMHQPTRACCTCTRRRALRPQ